MKENRVPAPAETPVDLIVSGETSTLKNIKIAHVGQLIPKTYSCDRVENTPGFTWYVSRHYALKTDFSNIQAHEYLELLELAYPHYRELFGADLPDLDEKRMCCIYGKDREALIRAMASDHMTGDYGYGGITQEGFHASYLSPSNPWHGRYILLHECVHLYQYCLETMGQPSPGHWYVEGLAESLSYHVFNPSKKQLTVYITEKAAMEGKDTAEAWFKEHGNITFEHMCRKGEGGYGPYSCTSSFLRYTPEWNQKFKLLQAESNRLWDGFSDASELYLNLTHQIYGPWEEMNLAFKQWCGSLRKIYWQASWGFDQCGDAMLSFGCPGNEDRYSQMNIELAPGQTPVPAPYLMCYPPEPLPATVGPIQRGIEEPSVGCEIDFKEAGERGMAGLALGRRDKKHFRVMIDQAKTLVVDGSDLGLEIKEMNLPAELRAAMERDNDRVGLTLTIQKRSLAIRVCADRNQLEAMSASVPLSEADRERLMNEPMAVVGVGARHWITPFVQDGRPEFPNLLEPAAPNRWRNEADPHLALVYKAEWVLGEQAPACLVAMKDKLLSVAEKDKAEQRSAIEAFHASLPEIVKAIRQSSAGEDNINVALTYLSGVRLYVIIPEPAEKGAVMKPAVIVYSSVIGGIEGDIRISCGPTSSTNSTIPPARFVLEPRARARIDRSLTLAEEAAPFYVAANGEFTWFGQTFHIDAQKTGNTGIPGYQMIGPFANDDPAVEGQPTNKVCEIEKEPLNFTKYYYGQAGNMFTWRKTERAESVPVDSVHLVHMVKHFASQADQSIAYAVAWVESPMDREAWLTMGSNDGIIAYVNDEKVHESFKGRDWRSRQDGARIQLKKGKNKLFFKLLHKSALWFFSADIEDESARPIDGIKYSLL